MIHFPPAQPNTAPEVNHGAEGALRDPSSAPAAAGRLPLPEGAANPNGRQRLHSRRQHLGESFVLAGIDYHVGAGPKADGREVGEIFITGPKQGSQAAAFAEDLGTMASILLQLGYSPARLADALSREGVAREALIRAQRMAGEKWPGR